MTPKPFTIAVSLATALLSAHATVVPAQYRPKLHVNPRWKECSFQLDSSLTQAAWHQFTQEGGQVVYFRPLTGAQPMGRGNFEFSLMQWQTNVNDNSSAWNDTFVHPDSTHWLYEEGGLKFPGLAFRAGLTSTSDVGLYYTKNPRANYGVYGVQLQQNFVRGGPRDWDVSARASFMSLFGPEDLDLKVYGVDVVTSWKQWTYKAACVFPYVGVATYLSNSHEKTAAVNLADEHVLGVMATVGAELQFSVVRFGAEASIARVPSISMKLGIAR